MVDPVGLSCCGNGHRRRLGKKVVSSPAIKDSGAEMGIRSDLIWLLQIAILFHPNVYFVLGALSYILKWPALNEDPITKTIAALIIGRWH